MRLGTVFLVGAGPGDPRLLTLRGAELLQRADVVVHDRLAPAALLALAPAAAEIVDVGKGVGRGPRQEDICDLLVGLALRGLDVVRLKGGDPFVFGRGGEEALACARAGVPFEVVPGVSSAVAAPAAAGIPVTHRGVAASFAVVTATLSGGADNELGRVAANVDTVVVLMAAGRLDRVCRAVIDAGRSPDEPAAAVQWATTPRQRTVVGTLATLPELARREGVGAPATLVIGPVVDLAFVLGAATSPAAAESAGDGGSEHEVFSTSTSA